MSSSKGFFPSLIAGKCPKCRTGKVFTHPFYNFTKFSSVHSHCPACGTKFETEPGFFWGAMYFSYALNVGIAIITILTLFILFNDPEYWVYVTVIVPLILILNIPMVRFSRLLLMYVAAPYRKYNPNLKLNTK